MVEIEYAKFTFLDKKGNTRRTAFGIIISPGDEASCICAAPFDTFEELRTAITEEYPDEIIDTLAEFPECDITDEDLITLNGEYLEIEEKSEEDDEK